MIIKNAEPFYFPGNSIGCLLIHGFTGAPTEMRSLGDFYLKPENMSRIYRELGTAEENKEMAWRENSGHVVTRDHEKMTLFNNIHNFVQRIQDPNP